MPPKPNYAFEKRQRELEKKQKKAEKAQRKVHGVGEPGDDAADAVAEGTPEVADGAQPPDMPAGQTTPRA